MKTLYFILAALILSSCEFWDNGLTIRADKETFIKERAAWDKQNLKNYQFTYKYFNDAGPVGPVKITIKENEEPIIENENQYHPYSFLENMPDIYDYINGTFDYIESVKNGTYSGHKVRSISLDITYNTQYHYPIKVNLSTAYVESVDGGAYYTLDITEFK